MKKLYVLRCGNNIWCIKESLSELNASYESGKMYVPSYFKKYPPVIEIYELKDINPVKWMLEERKKEIYGK